MGCQTILKNSKHKQTNLNKTAAVTEMFSKNINIFQQQNSKIFRQDSASSSYIFHSCKCFLNPDGNVPHCGHNMILAISYNYISQKYPWGCPGLLPFWRAYFLSSKSPSLSSKSSVPLWPPEPVPCSRDGHQGRSVAQGLDPAILANSEDDD